MAKVYSVITRGLNTPPVLRKYRERGAILGGCERRKGGTGSEGPQVPRTRRCSPGGIRQGYSLEDEVRTVCRFGGATVTGYTPEGLGCAAQFDHELCVEAWIERLEEAAEVFEVGSAYIQAQLSKDIQDALSRGVKRSSPTSPRPGPGEAVASCITAEALNHG